MKLFVDASAWIALFDKADKYHQQASQELHQVRNQVSLITSDYVLNEALTFLLYKGNKNVAVRCGQWALDATFVDIIHIDESTWLEAWKLFQAYEDKEWAFTDCTSFILMRRYSLWQAFSFDHHFTQAGFQLWPGPSNQ
jgi:predicted nucleic acid-binding protein